jgi:hypothetical protein
MTKIAATACSIAALCVLGVSASAQTNEPIDEAKLTAGKVNIVAGIVEAECGEVVQFPIYVYNNKEPGFAASNIRLTLDEELKPLLKTNGKPDAKLGEVALESELSSEWDYNEAERTVALTTSGEKATPGNGVFYTVKVTVPENPDREKFPVRLVVDSFGDSAKNPVDYVTIDGYIHVFLPHPDGPQTTTTEPTTAPTTVSTTDSTAAPTTAPTASGNAAVTTTSKQAAVTTTSAKAGAAVTTTKAGTFGSATAAKTGDAGVGVAAAGLLLAAGTAAAVTRKKKD